MSQRDGYLKDDRGFEFSTAPASRLSETWTQDRWVIDFDVLISQPRYLFLQEQQIAKLFLILLTFLRKLISSIFASILTAFLRFQELHDIRAAYSKSKTFYVCYIYFKSQWHKGSLYWLFFCFCLWQNTRIHWRRT